MRCGCTAATSAARRRLLFEVLSQEDASTSTSPLATLVKRLQESLSRMESFDVVTASQSTGTGMDGELRLVASSLSGLRMLV